MKEKEKKEEEKEKEVLPPEAGQEKTAAPASALPEEGESETAACEAVRAQMAQDARFPEFERRLPETERVIAALPVMAQLSPADRYTLAYLVGRGLESAQKKAPTPKELVDALLASPDAVRLYETVRGQELAEKGEAIPPHSASKGAATIPATVKKAPKNLSEARQEAYGYFGLDRA
ncbi:MAG: hypothetical protein IJR89_03155 [Clostridia bacterium]|nr:hypothetical protein [Clostridia bacterium]